MLIWKVMKAINRRKCKDKFKNERYRNIVLKYYILRTYYLVWVNLSIKILLYLTEHKI